MNASKFIGASIAVFLPLAAVAGAKTIKLKPKAKWSLKKKGKKKRHKVYFRLKFSKKQWRKIRKARAKVKVNFYGGDSADETRALHKRKKKFWGKKLWRKFGRKAKSRKWVRSVCRADEKFVQAVQQLRGHSDTDVNGEFPVDLLTALYDRSELQSRCHHILDDEPSWLFDSVTP